MTEKNIIAVRRSNPEIANKAFNEFMSLTETEMNAQAKANPSRFKGISPFELERLTERCMKDVSPATPFRKEEIKLVSGHAFPDISAETYYGVEVKSTQKDHWRSVGSSIVENTRLKDVETIYMMFGKLGGKIPEFRCRLYASCLYDITVTHSPRYLIDMETEEGSSIFDKMHFPYDELRTSPDSIAKVRRFYKAQAQSSGQKQMPWWIESFEEEMPGDSPDTLSAKGIMVKHTSSLTAEEKSILKAQLLLLFPKSMLTKEYSEPAMWLVSYHNIVCHNMRDYFTSGGKAKHLNGEALQEPVSAVVKTFLNNAPKVASLIPRMEAEIDLYNPSLRHASKSVFQVWVEQVDALIRNHIGGEIPFADWVNNGSVLSI